MKLPKKLNKITINNNTQKIKEKVGGYIKQQIYL